MRFGEEIFWSFAYIYFLNRQNFFLFLFFIVACFLFCFELFLKIALKYLGMLRYLLNKVEQFNSSRN